MCRNFLPYILRTSLVQLALIFNNQQYRQTTYNITLRRVSATIAVLEKSISITQPVCVFVALRIT